MSSSVPTTPRAAASLQAAYPVGARLALILAGSAVFILSAKLQVPFWPVPMTFQLLATLALAGLFGGRLAAAMFAAYLLEGACGLPVFANSPERGIGLAYMAGPTGGYLAGFLVAAFVAGSWIHRGRVANLAVVGGKMLVGLLIVYGMGVLWLLRFVAPGVAFDTGVLLVLPGDLLKVALAAALTVGVARLRRTA